MLQNHPKSTKITTKNEHQFLCRMLLNTEKYENYQEKWTSVHEPDVVEHEKYENYRKNEHQFLGRMLLNTEKYEN